MMTIKEMNAIREELGLTYQRICRESGVPIGTIQKVLSGQTRNPRMETMRRLEETLGAMKRIYDLQHGQEIVYGAGSKEKTGDSLHEPLAVYGYSPKEGSAAKEPHLYTVEEREALPDDRRTELIDGVLYDMASPSMPHQSICFAFGQQIDDCIRRHHSKCQVFISPADVCLDRDRYTMIQPDVFIVCDRSQITRKNIQGAPAFVLEILSPSTRKIDKEIKLFKYLNAGVQEYWIIDPDKRKIIVFEMAGIGPDSEGESEDSYKTRDPYEISLYGFSDRIPLAVSDGKCVIDMNPIRELLEDLYGE